MHSSKASEIKIPPNLLKNFNVYDILEPEKNGGKNSDATKVDKLVDIDDCSQDSGFQDSDLNPAFLDKNRDFDLVDLYQNIFVTPQHIKTKKATDEIDAPFSASKVVDAGFKQFFDMLESGEKIDWTNITQTEKDSITKHDFIEKKPRVLVPKVFTEPDSDPEDVIDEVLLQKKLENIALGNVNRNSFKGNSITKHDFIEKKPRVLVPKVFTEPDSDPEDVIDEVLLQKKLENIALGNVNRNSFKGNSITKHDFIEKKPRVLVPKVFTEPDSDPEDVIDEVLLQKKLENIALGNVNRNSFKGNSSEPPERESPKNIKKSDVIPEFSRLNSNIITKDSKFESGRSEYVTRPSEIEPCPVDSKINNSLPNFTVRAIRKDEKIYKKKRLLKPEIQTANYTKGPDFYEKSVVLPQIMARLHARLAYLDEKGNQKKRFILDAGAKPKSECSSSNANAQVKRKPDNQASSSTLNAKEQAKTTPNNQAKSSPFTKNDLTKKAPNTAHSLKLNNERIKEEARLCINKVTKDIRVHTTDKPCMNCANPATAKKANNSSVATSNNSDYGKLSPVVLMEDCNKERLRALKQSQMFKDFVLKGKYDL